MIENNESNTTENIKEFISLNIFNKMMIEPIKLTIDIDFKIVFSNI